MKIIKLLKEKWKFALMFSLMFALTASGFFYIGKYSIKRIPIESMGESFAIMTDFSFTTYVEITETPNITRSGEELSYFSRTYVVNSSQDYSNEYLTALSLWLLINGGPRDVRIRWAIGLMYAGFIRNISIDEKLIGFLGNSTIIVLVYQNLNLRFNNFTVSNIEYIFSNVSVEESFIG
ncbi:MAG: hypothetical protein KAU62_05075 [Candidatus Heimdallarchaeota archaeon]|nr:hypothetical protein [Candidatus Heimdallarchaeota archaeon]MCK4610511.1 hypothetical protein [Candidatus Heimdallarchaeota archaeon]